MLEAGGRRKKSAAEVVDNKLVPLDLFPSFDTLDVKVN
jgi:hypothetical protein